MKMEIQHNKSYGMQQSSSEREVHTDKCLHQEQERSQTNNLTLHLKELEKEQSPKLMEGKKDHCRHKWNRDEKNNGKDQWNEELGLFLFVFWKDKDKQNRPLDKLSKRKRERTQIKSEMYEETSTTYTTEIQRIIRLLKTIICQQIG